MPGSPRQPGPTHRISVTPQVIPRQAPQREQPPQRSGWGEMVLITTGAVVLRQVADDAPLVLVGLAFLLMISGAMWWASRRRPRPHPLPRRLAWMRREPRSRPAPPALPPTLAQLRDPGGPPDQRGSDDDPPLTASVLQSPSLLSGSAVLRVTTDVLILPPDPIPADEQP